MRTATVAKQPPCALAFSETAIASKTTTPIAQTVTRTIVLACAAIVATLISMASYGIAHAATITLPEDSPNYVPDIETRIPLAAENLVFEQGSAFIREDETDNCLYLLLPKPTNSTIKTCYDDPCTLSFPRAASIGRRDIDVTIHVNCVTVWPRWSSVTQYEDKTYFSFGRLIFGKNTFEIGSWTKTASYRYHAAIEADLEFEITWSDTGETVALPFIDAVYDLDQPTNTRSIYDPTFQKGYAESFEPVSGFTGDYYVFPSSTLLIQNNRFQANSSASLENYTSWYRAGVVAPTKTGSWRAKYYASDSGTFISLYSSYLGLEQPEKHVDSNRYYHEGDQVEYTVTQHIGVWNATYATYQSVSFEDYIPAGLSYQSMSVTIDGGNDITANGTKSYNQRTRRASFNFNKTWLSNPSRYAGKTLTWHITCKVNTPTALTSTIKNTGTTIFGGEYYDTNEVEIIVHDKTSLTIRKKISAIDIADRTKNVPFIFAIAGSSWTRYEVAEINPLQQPDEDGFIVAQFTLEGIPEDTYVVSEIPVSQFSISSIDGGTPGSSSTVVDIAKAVREEVSFTNERSNRFGFSDSSCVVNHLKKSDDPALQNDEAGA